MIGQHLIFICFFFALGACVGSFLNVVVWRLPRGEGLIRPPSHCPNCNHLLAWRDNVPVFGWIMLRGKCRYCKNPIAARYPIVEAITGLIFVAYYLCFFIFQVGPCPLVPNWLNVFGLPANRPLTIQQDWAIYGLYIFLVSALLAASLIDAELFEIPRQISYWAAGVGLVVHAIFDFPKMPGAVNASPPGAALAIGAGVGLLISLGLLKVGILPLSFAEGTPDLDIDKERRATGADAQSEPPRDFTRTQIRVEMRKEMLFLIAPLILGAAALVLTRLPALASVWRPFVFRHDWFSGFCGALLGGLTGGFAIWFTRIVFSVVLGKEAMGLGDIDLMFGIGAVLGGGGSMVAFFLAPFCGMGIVLYRLILRKSHQIPYGPYLSMGAAITMLFYCPIAAYFSPGLMFLVEKIRERIGV